MSCSKLPACRPGCADLKVGTEPLLLLLIVL